ncbi:MAG: histidine kinase [Parasporobacterium sp.]|nr:histidine kinase [Parasporobacterium sp.]
MKMSVKLIILFSVLAAVVTLAFTFISYHSSLDNLYANTHTSLNTMSTMMQTEIEDYIRLMDYSMEELTSNSVFMDSFHTISDSGDIEYSVNLVNAQTQMSRIMYEAPLSSAFFRVSVYNRDGFFLTSRFEKTDAIVSFSDEARDTVDSLEYLERLDNNPYGHLILGAHPDPWSIRGNVLVFTDVRAVMYHGELIGYLEVSAPLDDLANIFLVLEQEGISTQAIFDNGDDLFRMWKDDYDYGDIPLGEMLHYQIEGASDRLVVRQHSKTLGLDIYISQEIDALGNTRSAILKRSLMIMLPILLFAVFMVVLISLGLTRSIRKLQGKINELPADAFLAHTENTGPVHVITPRDPEMYELEQTFNNMLTKLRESHDNEVSLREGTLKAQLNALQLQINPHFIYNTLNIISAKGLESGSEEITELCDQFARMLRYSTDVRSQTATLREELDHVRNYLYLCKARYEDHLEFEIDVPEEMMDTVIPRLTLQPLVENSLKYGVKGADFQRRILILGYYEEGKPVLIVQDNGDGFDWDTLSRLRKTFRRIEKGDLSEDSGFDGHLGLINTYRRIYYYCHGNFRMDLYNENGAVVKLYERVGE